MTLHFIPLVLLIFTSELAHAEVFSCKDKNGRLYTSDQLISECADQPVRVYRDNGVLRQEIPAPLTLEERQQARNKLELTKKLTEQKNNQRKEDQYLRAHFSSANDIEKKRQEELKLISNNHTEEDTKIVFLTKILRKTQEDKQNLSNNTRRDNTVAIENLHNKEMDLEQQINAALQSNIDLQHQETQVNVKYDRYISRFLAMQHEETSAAEEIPPP